ncbi:MAG: choice-of-anchor J domain-containing protein [Bacteroides sp.]|nr:choice-of-anchor J domain-containing protein [Bacteroides sp.]
MKRITLAIFLYTLISSVALCREGRSRATDLPLTLDFELFNGVNLTEMYPGWLEGKGYGIPQIMNSGWYRGDVLYGSATASVTFDYIGLKDEWIISPEFVATETTKISFKAALSRIWDDPSQGNLSFNDSVSVLVSLGDFNFEHLVHPFKFANQPSWIPQDYDFSLGQFAGQTIRVAFYASNGQEANSLAAFHLDDIVIKDATGQDALAHSLVAPAANACFEAQQPVVVRIKNDGLEPISSVPVRVRVRGAVTQNLFGAFAGVIEPGEYVELEVGMLQDPPFGEYTFSVEVELPGDGYAANDAKGGIVLSHSESLNLPLPSMNFMGFYTDNLSGIYPGWFEARGKDYPRVVMDTDWQGENFSGSRTASVYYVQLGTEDWMIGPKFTASPNLAVSLRAAVQYEEGVTQMGADDKLAIMISDDCGASWEQVAALERGSGLIADLQPFTFPISEYGGEEVILACYATTGSLNNPESYILHITDIEIKNQFEVDAGVTALLSPGNVCSFTDAEEVEVEMTNFGTQALENFEVAYSLNGQEAVVETVNQTLSQGETFAYTFNTTIDLSEGVDNVLSVYTLVEGDENGANDGLYEVALQLSSFDLATEGTFTMGFEPDEDFSSWLVEDGNNDGTLWVLNPDPVHANNGSHSYSYMSNQTSVASNDWLISPCFNLQAGATYYISFYYKNRASTWPESLKLNLGNAQQGSSMSQLIIDLGSISNSTYQLAETTFTVTESGEYYFGWHAYGAPDLFGMHVDDITIYQVFDYDLAVTNAIIHRDKDENCGLLPASTIEVEVTNYGSTTVNAFGLALQIEGQQSIEFSFNETIEAGGSQWVVLENGFTIAPDQVYQLVFWSQLDEDQNPVNNAFYLSDYLMQQYHTSFEPTDDVSEWVVQNVAGVNQWQVVQDASVANTGDYSFAIRTDGAGGNTINDDWLFSECFYLEAGKCYAFSFFYRSRYSTENLALHIGSGQSAAQMEDLLINLPSFNSNSYLQAVQQFTVEESGVYYFGWHTQGGTSGRYYIYVDDVVVVEDLDNQPVVNPAYEVLDHEVAFFANADNVTYYLWDFGDGNTSDEVNPFHVYAAPGTFEASLTAGSGCVNVMVTFTVELDLPVYEVSFEVQDLNASPISGAVVTVEGQTGDPGDYVFEFAQGGYSYVVSYEDSHVSGNFTVIDANLLVPVVLPIAGETYTVTFVVNDEQGDDITDAVITLAGDENDPGDYVFENVAPGTYAWVADHPDFLYMEDEVTVVDQDVIVNVSMITTSVHNPSIAGMKVFPNPAGDRLYVTFYGPVNGLRIVNLIGRVLVEQAVESNEPRIEVPLDGLRPGTYVLQIISERKVLSQTFLKR